jgi:hypothetical protein
MVQTQAQKVKKAVDEQLASYGENERPTCRMLAIDTDSHRDDLWVVVIGVPNDTTFGITGSSSV